MTATRPASDRRVYTPRDLLIVQDRMVHCRLVSDRRTVHHWILSSGVRHEREVDGDAWPIRADIECITSCQGVGHRVQILRLAMPPDADETIVWAKCRRKIGIAD